MRCGVIFRNDCGEDSAELLNGGNGLLGSIVAEFPHERDVPCAGRQHLSNRVLQRAEATLDVRFMGRLPYPGVADRLTDVPSGVLSGTGDLVLRIVENEMP